MIKLAVLGATGRMGSRITALAVDSGHFTLTTAVERKNHKDIGKDIGLVLGLGQTGVILTDDIDANASNTDVWITFSTPEATMLHLESASRHKKALIIGTTGLDKEQVDRIKQASTSIPIVFAYNMSLGVNLLLKVLKDVAVALGDDYDIEIIEAHHRLKKDAPSGTALKMAQVIAEAMGRSLDEHAVYCRHGIIGERTKKEIGIQTIRAGDIVGEHTVIFGGLGERIEITHKASSRDTFARGALKAASWIADKKPGLYDMQDVLGLKGK